MDGSPRLQLRHLRTGLFADMDGASEPVVRFGCNTCSSTTLPLETDMLLKTLASRAALTRRLRSAVNLLKKFPGSGDYWDKRYREGGTSGTGSYGKLGQFKADTLNALVRELDVRTVIEHGCGDGNVLSLVEYPSYIGLDVSHYAITRCRERFADDPTKSFKHLSNYAGERAELSLSLDVIFHLVEDHVFDDYMRRLFMSGTRLVVIYSSNTAEQKVVQARHVKHRRFTDWVDQNAAEWALHKHIPNPYPPASGDEECSFADFFVYLKH